MANGVYKQTLPRTLLIQQRRKKALQIAQENPGIPHAEIAQLLGVSSSTIASDFKAMTEEFQLQNKADFATHHKRILGEIILKKQMCMDKLAACTSPTQGARWMEEYTKLVQIECKILHLFDPKKLINEFEKGDSKLSKRERDAIVSAVIDEDVIPLKSANPVDFNDGKTITLPVPT